MVQKKTSEKATFPNKQKERKKERKNHVWLSGRLRIEGRLNEGPRLQRKHKDESEAKQNSCNTRERRHGICKPNARRIQVRATCGLSTRASEPARAHLLWVMLSLILPATFGHTTACRSPASAFSAATNFAMKCSASCSAVLRHSPSSWAAVVHWSGEALTVINCIILLSYINIHLLNYVLQCFCLFLSGGVPAWRLINVVSSVQFNGGLLPDIILLTIVTTIGEPD